MILPGRHYWKSSRRWNSRTGAAAEIEKARGYFEETIRDDPQYAPAYSGLADYYNLLPLYSNSKPDAVFPKAKAAVAKAIELDDSLAEAYASLAYIRTYYDWDFADAGRESRRALVLNHKEPREPESSSYLSSLGRIDEALDEIHRAQLLDPLSMAIPANVGVINYFGRRYDAAMGQLQNVLKEDPKFWLAH